MMSAAASLGLSLLWDTEEGLSHVDKYTYSSEEHIKVSTLCVVTVCPAYRSRSRQVWRSPGYWLDAFGSPERL